MLQERPAEAPRVPSVVVFDVGQVLLNWDPRHLYRRIIPDPDRMEWFLAHVCPDTWNRSLDGGRPWDEALAERIALHGGWADEIRAYRARWQEMVPDAIGANVALLARLKAAGVPVYAITNFAGDLFRETQDRFPFLKSFDGVVVSGDEGLLKPDPAIYRLFLARFGLRAEACLFIDDSPANVAGARDVGMTAIQYRSGDDLAAACARLGLLPVNATSTIPARPVDP
ncbi:MAG TPA: HAD family phosphatase [Beijerinckiaceae bacterium]